MNVCIDVGNTTVSVGIFEGDNLVARMTTNTDITKTEEEYASTILNQIKINNIDVKKVEKVIYSSVVPSLNRTLKEAFIKIFGIKPITIGPGLKTGLSLKVDNPSEVGNDLIADLVGTKTKYGYPALIVDLGTASKILLLDKTGTFVSCLIMPGLSLSAASLTNKAALLPEATLETPSTILAKNTITAMNAGIVYGHVDMIDGLIRRYEKTIGYPCKHILTGGGATIIQDIVPKDYIYDQNINLIGLNELIKKQEVK